MPLLGSSEDQNSAIAGIGVNIIRFNRLSIYHLSLPNTLLTNTRIDTAELHQLLVYRFRQFF